MKKPVRSILIIQYKFLGDLVLTSALVSNLRHHFKNSKVVILCTVGFESFLVDHGIADASIPYSRKRMRGSLWERGREFYRLIRQLRAHRFDLTIDLTDRKTTRTIIGLINAPVRIGFNPPEKPLRKWERQTNNFFSVPYGYRGKHFVDHYLAPLETLGLNTVSRIPVLNSLSPETDRAFKFLVEHGFPLKTFIVVHAGASFIGRCWQPERFAAAINQISQKSGIENFILVGGPGETELADTILAASSSRIVNGVGKFPLGTLLAILQQARLFLGNESGPMHLAAAAGTPVVGLYGLTDPVRWGPLGVNHIAVRPPMPCNCIDPRICNWPDPSVSCCVWHLSVDEVVAATCKLLAMDGPDGGPSFEVVASSGIPQQPATKDQRH